MDQTDAKILQILQQDGRISMQRLASMINMSAPSTIERVKKLEESGVITGYKAIVNSEKAGRKLSALVLVSVPLETRKRFLKYVEDSQNILEFLEITGRFGYCLRTVCEDPESFLKMTYELYELGLTESYVIMNKYSQTRPITPIL